MTPADTITTAVPDSPAFSTDTAAILPVEAHGVPAITVTPKKQMPQNGTQVQAAAATDSLRVDSALQDHEPAYAIVLTPTSPGLQPDTHSHSQSTGMSVILGILILLFTIIALRFRNNRKYMATLFRDLVEVRDRNNIFDETVRESSFLLLLNILWSFSAGILLWGALEQTSIPEEVEYLVEFKSETISICMLCMMLYTAFMSLAYLTVGTVFTDSLRARMWLKGFTSAQGISSFLLFPLALLLLFYPGWCTQLLWVSLIVFILAKLVFIWKGFRIFFNQLSSWVLFLYYLCSLEIVPLILTFISAQVLCRLIPDVIG